MKSVELNTNTFIEVLASDAPAPGGGGAAAFVGAIGVALSNMVASLTLGKEKFADVQDEIGSLKEQANTLQERFLFLMDEDARVFEPLSRAYGLPKGTPEELAHKESIMAECLLSCAQVPLDMMHVCAESIVIAERMEQIGTPIAVSDVGCSAVMLKAALLSAELNVCVNTKLMKDRSCAEELNAKARQLVDVYVPMAETIYSKVQARYC